MIVIADTELHTSDQSHTHILPIAATVEPQCIYLKFPQCTTSTRVPFRSLLPTKKRTVTANDLVTS